jgi:hypothetical protein
MFVAVIKPKLGTATIDAKVIDASISAMSAEMRPWKAGARRSPISWRTDGRRADGLRCLAIGAQETTAHPLTVAEAGSLEMFGGRHIGPLEHGQLLRAHRVKASRQDQSDPKNGELVIAPGSTGGRLGVERQTKR